jgi:hypothetical protein
MRVSKAKQAYLDVTILAQSRRKGLVTAKRNNDFCSLRGEERRTDRRGGEGGGGQR